MTHSSLHGDVRSLSVLDFSGSCIDILTKVSFIVKCLSAVRSKLLRQVEVVKQKGGGESSLPTGGIQSVNPLLEYP